MNIIAVDWGKDTRKRSAFKAEFATRKISRLPLDGRLSDLVDYAGSLTTPVLIGIDAAIGFPAAAWNRLIKQTSFESGNFADFLLGAALPTNFFDPVTKPNDWSPQRPFIRPPVGSWSLNAFVEGSRHGIYRHIDLRLNGNPIFVMSGIPGSVGSGTRALWQELIALSRASTFRVWPFHGSLDTLLGADTPVIAEIYPKACYGIALARTLPTSLLSIGKTRATARKKALAQLQDSDWVAREQIILQDVEAALPNEDDFDALLSAAALLRMFIERASVESPETVDSISEGGILGAACLTTSRRRTTESRAKKSVTPTETTRAPQAYYCPIPGCAHVFYNTRGGWGAHVASLSRHPQWHPKIVDSIQRKRLFRREFSYWFQN